MIGPGPDVIGKRQRALPIARRIGPAQVFEDRPGVSVRNRCGRNFRQLRRLFRRGAFGIRQRWQRRNPRRGGIAGKLKHVADGTALHAGIGTPGTLRVFVTMAPSVVSGIGIDKHAGRAVFLRHKRFYPTKILPVAHQYQFAAHIDFHLLEFLKIVRRSIVRIHNFGFHITRRRHAVEWHDHTRVILVGIATYPLASRAVHGHSGGSGDVHADFCRDSSSRRGIRQSRSQGLHHGIFGQHSRPWPCPREYRPCGAPGSECAGVLRRASDREQP